MSSRRLRLGVAALLIACGNGACDRRAQLPVDAELQALVDSMLPELARLASLEPRQGVHLERRTSAQVRAYVESRLDEELPPERIRELQTIYSLLGVIPDTLDLRALLLELYTEQIVGYYDPHADALYVVDGVAPAEVAPVLAHELVHALQDQHADLAALLARERGNDRQAAAHAALEGHATVVMFAFLAGQSQGGPVDFATLPNPADQLAAGLLAQNDEFPVFRSAPAIIRETTLFPYVQGADFLYRLWQAEPRSRPAPLGDWLPQSTEQVLHPERFLERDEPAAIRLSAAAGGWQGLGVANGLGELETGIVLAHHLGPDARRLAHGWDGDVYRLLATARGDTVLLWHSVWDDPAAAERFANAVRRLPSAPGRAAFQVERGAIQGLPTVRVLVTRPSAAVDTSGMPRLELATPPQDDAAQRP